jgi:hypothetical protein
MKILAEYFYVWKNLTKGNVKITSSSHIALYSLTGITFAIYSSSSQVFPNTLALTLTAIMTHVKLSPLLEPAELQHN